MIIRQQNFKTVQSDCQARLERLLGLTSASARGSFKLELSLDVVNAKNNPVAASLGFLRSELARDRLPSIITFSIEHITSLETNQKFDGFVNLKLKTISDDGEYWINSGLLIDKI